MEALVDRLVTVDDEDIAELLLLDRPKAVVEPGRVGLARCWRDAAADGSAVILLGWESSTPCSWVGSSTFGGRDASPRSGLVPDRPGLLAALPDSEPRWA